MLERTPLPGGGDIVTNKNPFSFRWFSSQLFLSVIDRFLWLSLLSNISKYPNLPTCLISSVRFPEPQLANHSSKEPFGRSEEESVLSSEGQRTPEITVLSFTPSPPPPPSPSPPPPTEIKDTNQTPKLFTPSKLSFTVRTSLTPSFVLPDKTYLVLWYVSLYVHIAS